MRRLLYLDTLQGVPSFHLSLGSHIESLDGGNLLFRLHHSPLGGGSMC